MSVGLRSMFYPEILQVSLPWILVGWLMNLLAVFAFKCKCRQIPVSRIRRTGLIAIISGRDHVFIFALLIGIDKFDFLR